MYNKNQNDRIDILTHLSRIANMRISSSNFDKQTQNDIKEVLQHLISKLKHSYWKVDDIKKIRSTMHSIGPKAYTTLMVILNYPIRGFLKLYFPNYFDLLTIY